MAGAIKIIILIIITVILDCIFVSKEQNSGYEAKWDWNEVVFTNNDYSFLVQAGR